MTLADEAPWPDEPPWPDAELVLLDLLKPLVPAGTTVTQTDEDLTPPCIQVQRIGGTNDGITDRPLMQVTAYGRTRPDAWELARAVEQHILAAGGTAVSGEHVTTVLIDHTETSTAGRQTPYVNPDIRTVISDFRLDFRRQY